MLCENNNIHFIDISLWDSFKLVDDGPFTGESLLKLFTTIDRGSKLLTVAGKIFSYEDIEILQNNNVDFFCLGRAAILDHQFPNRLKAEGSNFQPYSAPVTRDHLLKEGLSAEGLDKPGFLAQNIKENRKSKLDLDFANANFRFLLC